MLGDEALLLGSKELVKPLAIDLLRHPTQDMRGAALLDDAVPEVGDAWGLDHPGAFQLPMIGAEDLEHPHPVAQEHGYEVDLQLVEQPSLEVLLGDARAAAHRDVLVAGCLLRLLERRLDAVG